LRKIPRLPREAKEEIFKSMEAFREKLSALPSLDSATDDISAKG